MPKSLGIKQMAIGTSILVILIAIGILLYQGTKQTVTVIVDGKKQIVKTHATTIGELLKSLEIRVSSKDYIFPSKSSRVKDDLQVVWKPAHQVKILQDGKMTKVWTTADTVGELLEKQGVQVAIHQKVTPAKDQQIKGNIEVDIENTFPLTLLVGDTKKQVWSTSTTVADFLRQQGVKLNTWDRVEPKLTEKVAEKNIIKVTRVEKVTDVVESQIKFNTVKTEDPSLENGAQKILKKGQMGRKVTQYEVVKENGKEVSRKVLSEMVMKEKRDQVIAISKNVTGAMVMKASSASGREIYVNSTAYTANCNGCSGFTATGMNLKSNPGAKVIAVDPSIIPLGSKVYVEGYGYAIAADKGNAIKGNKIDVFFSSTSEAYRWGVKRVKIRVLN